MNDTPTRLWQWPRAALTALMSSRDASSCSSATPTCLNEKAPASSLALGEQDSNSLVEKMLFQGRYSLLLRKQLIGNLSIGQRDRAMEILETNMALVPCGVVALRTPSYADEVEERKETGSIQVPVNAVFLDRYPVTNQQFQHFVDAGGYADMGLWYEESWAAMLDFVDTTGDAGPAFWVAGSYQEGFGNHPVVGVSWYEAMAYARWVGKRLPSDPEWVKAGAWPIAVGGGAPQQRHFPWGDTFDAMRAATWECGLQSTAEVSKFPSGVSPGGVYHLIGNVWEWMYDDFEMWQSQAKSCEGETLLKSIRGGAFDTYFECQLTCQFSSGESFLSRKRNIGFRCALRACDLATVETGKESRGEGSSRAADNGLHQEALA